MLVVVLCIFDLFLVEVFDLLLFVVLCSFNLEIVIWWIGQFKLLIGLIWLCVLYEVDVFIFVVDFLECEVLLFGMLVVVEFGFFVKLVWFVICIELLVCVVMLLCDVCLYFGYVCFFGVMLQYGDEFFVSVVLQDVWCLFVIVNYVMWQIFEFDLCCCFDVLLVEVGIVECVCVVLFELILGGFVIMDGVV